MESKKSEQVAEWLKQEAERKRQEKEARVRVMMWQWQQATGGKRVIIAPIDRVNDIIYKLNR